MFLPRTSACRGKKSLYEALVVIKNIIMQKEMLLKKSFLQQSERVQVRLLRANEGALRVSL